MDWNVAVATVVEGGRLGSSIVVNGNILGSFPLLRSGKSGKIPVAEAGELNFFARIIELVKSDFVAEGDDARGGPVVNGRVSLDELSTVLGLIS